MFNVWTNPIGGLGEGPAFALQTSRATTVAAWQHFAIAQTGALGAFSVAIETISNPRFLTAVGMGGKTTDAFHLDATEVGACETFFIRKFGGPLVGDNLAAAGYFIVDTNRKQAIAARNGGGQTQNTIQFFEQSGVPITWAFFTLIPQSNGSFALRTFSNTYLTAVNGGGLDYGSDNSDNIHTNATIASKWEQFRFVPVAALRYDGAFLRRYRIELQTSQ